MKRLQFESRLDCPVERVRELLLDEGFLAAFVAGQHPASHRVDVDRAAGRSAAQWSVSLPGSVPGIVRTLVGDTLDVTLTIDLGPAMRLDVDATGKRTGRLRSTLTLEPGEGGGTRLTVDGEVSVSAGLMSGQAETLARDQVLRPVLERDLVGLLAERCG